MRLFAVAWLGAWLLGITIGLFFDRLSLPVGISGALILTGAFLLRRAWPRRQRWPGLVGVLGLFGLGIMYGSAALVPGPLNCSVSSPLTTRIVQRLKVTDRAASYIAESSDDCQILVYTERWPLITQGSTVSIEGEIEQIEEIAEDQAGYARYLRSRGVAGVMRWGKVTVLSADASALDRFRAQGRELIGRIFPEPAASFTLAALLGEYGALPSRLEEEFRLAGVSHIIAISGLHLSLLAAVSMFLLLLVPLPRLYWTVLLLLIIWFYIWLVGAPSSAVRAAWLWTLTILFWRSGWLISLPTALILTFALMVSFDPVWLFDVGFQLSVTAVAGMWLVTFLTRPWRIQLRGPWSFFGSLLLLSIGAMLGTWPIILGQFGTFSVVSLAANLVVVPAMSVLMIVALLALVVGMIIPIAGMVLAWVVQGILLSMWSVVHGLVSLPGAFLEEASVPAWVLGIYYVGLVGLSIFILNRQNRRWREMWV